MRTRYKTQCPRCHTVYPMPDDKLDQPKARANCGKCHHTFFLNLHIINPSEVAAKNKLAAASGQNQTQTTPAQKTNAQAPAPTPKPTPTPADKKIAKKLASVPAGTELFDDNSPTADEAFQAASFDGLDDFLNNDVEIVVPVVAATKAGTPDGLEDEAWLDDLLKDNAPKIDKAAINTKPKDDLSDMIGADFANVIPTVAITEKMDKAEILKKVRERIDGHAPSQEQLATRRNPLWQLAWLAGCVFLVGLMAVQYSFFNLERLIKSPDQAQLFHSVCNVLSCNLPSANSQAFSTDYQLLDGTADFTTNLLGDLTNTSSNAQLYPNLKVSIHGHGGMLGAFIATPKDYLISEQSQLAPSQGRRFMLTIVDISKDDIANVSIEPFY